MEKLTEDVLINIFIRLPAKQLVQMRCVCKPWNAFLSAKSSYFIKSHLNHSIRNKHNNEIVVALNSDLCYRKRALPCTAYDLSQSPIMELNDLVKLPRNFPLPDALNKYVGICVVGSVNGLICFYIGDSCNFKGIYIWNPSLSVVKTLPPFSDQEYLINPDVHNGFRYEFCFGFGFDPKTDDYKVVKLTTDLDKLAHWGEPVEVYSMKKGSWEFIVDDFFPSDVNVVVAGGFVDDHDGHLYDELDSDDESADREQVEVYSMKKGSWEFIVDSFPENVDIEGDGRFVTFVSDHDGHLHWLCHYSNKKGRIQTIVAFDLGVESSFRRISLPDSIAYRENVLGMLEGKLCVMSYTRDDGKFEVWVMNEYGVARDSWVKSHALSKLNLVPGKRKRKHKHKRRRPLGFTSNNKFLFADDSKGLLGCYDQETDKVTHFGLSATVVPYVDSLVWYTSPTN